MTNTSTRSFPATGRLASSAADVVAILLVIAAYDAADLAVVGPIILQRAPAEGPGHTPIGPAGGKRIAQGLHVRGCVPIDLIVAGGLVAGDLDLIHADDAVKRQKAVAGQHEVLV